MVDDVDDVDQIRQFFKDTPKSLYKLSFFINIVNIINKKRQLRDLFPADQHHGDLHRWPALPDIQPQAHRISLCAFCS